ncbi:voltage-dependent calcium channel subunit alpha-2/delta-3 isoform X2 [Lingula anatina]|uniref:Voltage-dependent calcium channel subunit alpha-2/delta-3 isoform X2 n=1 Tax=Lingula anatina TaxID=7574 RepID=A0A1S3ISF0_LINAN|nr:voltage-dependent calcium channel subunit alpha-2/delta-3 isoform X2 [Lingula anatina]|eukprot:XP_013401127.1 voltage-dependent calcium channel subunit alpha-2/delta-3 isoform X2 [Lingula anatina]
MWPFRERRLFQICLLLISVDSLHSTLNIPIMGLRKSFKAWTAEISRRIYDLSVQATGLPKLRKCYEDEAKVEIMNGTKILDTVSTNMEKMLRKKEDAISRLVEAAEEANKQHTFDPEIDLHYYNAKRINEINEKTGNYVTTEPGATMPPTMVDDENEHLQFNPEWLNLTVHEDEHFNYVRVNLNYSTVHVPTDVYDRYPNVSNGISWSEKLDPVFKKNYEIDPTLTWQYFGSASGFFRTFPGMKWQYRGIDMFDCRTRGWYIQAAASPKDIVILLDSSGSMTGLRSKIARTTINKILDTLSDDDYFNIISYSTQPLYIDKCSNRTLIQANIKNKERLKEAVKDVEIKKIAHLDRALEEAFALLDVARSDGEGTQCNQAIMIISDGSPDTYGEVFEKWNRPNITVRVFTYLIGREVKDSREVSLIACANKGYYTHISTLADVQENVQKYVNVLSRPMVMQRARYSVWTSVYLDIAEPWLKLRSQVTDGWVRRPLSGEHTHLEKGLQLMTSVAQPVFDLKNETVQQGNLLGVMGTDVPLVELQRLIPLYKLGTNGYAFAITNNGYILFHPDFRPLKWDGKAKHNYNMVDLEDVEFPEGDNDLVQRLRTEMIDQQTGDMKIPIKMMTSNMTRVALRTNRYFYTPLEHTPFSLGLVFPDKYGLYDITNKINITSMDESMLNNKELRLAPWAEFCHLTTEETKQDRFEVFKRYIDKWRNEKEDREFEQRCDEELMSRILYDISVTHPMLAIEIGCNGWNLTKEPGVELVFMGTRHGVTRFYKNTEQLTDEYFVQTQINTIKDLYYERAADAGNDTFVFSVPRNASLFPPNETVITGSTGIFLHPPKTSSGSGGPNPKNLANQTNQALAAVIGLQIKLQLFREIMMNSTAECFESPGTSNVTCNSSCANDTLDCFLIDENGFIVVSENENISGLFLGEVDGPLMNKLSEQIRSQASTDENVFKTVDIIDYQAICDVAENTSGSFATRLMNPFWSVITATKWILNELAILFLEFNLYNWWNFSGTSARTHIPQQPITRPCDRVSTLTTLNLPDQYDPVVRSLPLCQFCSNCDNETACEIECSIDPGCYRSFFIQRVRNTNLFFLAVESTCTCEESMPISLEPREVRFEDDQECESMKLKKYRRRPDHCYNLTDELQFLEDYEYSLSEEEIEISGRRIEEDCGSSSPRIQVPHVTVLLPLVLIFYQLSH